jgi:hypothetical protein
MSLGAHPERDEALREAAEQIARFVRYEVQGIAHNQAAIRGLAEGRAIWGVFEVPQSVTDAINFSPIAFTMRLAFVREDRRIGSFDAKTNELTLYVLPRDAQRMAMLPAYRKTLESAIIHILAREEDVLVHEATHLLDAHRAPRMFENKPAWVGKKTEEERAEAYFNSPEEFNAFFQQIASLTLRHYRALSIANQKLVLSDFDRFMEIAEKTEPFQMISEYASPGLERKLAVRLWQVWDALLQEHAG